MPGAVDVTGAANAAATVSVNNEAAVRKVDYFYKELAVDNSAAPAYQGENVIKTGADKYWGHPLGEKSLLGWYGALRDAFNRPGARRFGEQRNSQVPGFDGNIKFLNVARIGMAVFDYRRTQQR